MKKIILTNQKGGVAKTTTAQALARGLHDRGYKVLAMDMDPQANFCFGMGVDERPGQMFYDVLAGRCDTSKALVNIQGGLDLLAVGLAGAAADMELSGRTAREYMARYAVEELEENYDFCIIDTAPTLGLLTLNALTLADLAIIPINAEIYSLQGMEQLNGFITNVRRYTNKGLRVDGLLRTRYQERLNITQALQDTTQKAATSMETKVYKTVIRESVAVREIQLFRESIYESASKAAATIDYNNFINEFLGGLENGK